MKKHTGSHTMAGFFLLALVVGLGGGLSIFMTQAALAITINEIHYGPKPAGSNGPNLEFIELFNEASEPVDLSNFTFIHGITFTFPYPSMVKGNGYIVVAADPQALLQANPLLKTDSAKFPRVVGPYTGKLDDSGETI